MFLKRPGRAQADDAEARREALRLATGGPVITHKTRTPHSEALIVRGTGYAGDHLDQPRARPSLSARLH